eukprot:Amastigsp_a843920_6.p3 type:complete len:195 gc:universal Amastigsp_a843920_6:581-1165(+)
MTYERTPSRRRVLASLCMCSSRLTYSAGSIHVILAPRTFMRNRLPVAMDDLMSTGRRSTTCGTSPKRRAAATVARAWFDCGPPQVMTAVAPALIAASRRYSSLRTLFPLSSTPVSESILNVMRTSEPSSMGSARSSVGVGSSASWTRLGSSACTRLRAMNRSVPRCIESMRDLDSVSSSAMRAWSWSRAAEIWR